MTPLVFKIFMRHILLSLTLHVKHFWQLSGSLVGKKRIHSGLLISSAVVVSHVYSFTNSAMTIFRSCKAIRLVCIFFFDDVSLSFCLCHIYCLCLVCVCACALSDASVFHCLLMYYCAAILILLCAQ